MKITALLVLKSPGDSSSSGGGEQQAVVLANAADVSHFGYFQRPAAREFIVFVARTVALRTPAGRRQSVQHEEYKVHCYNQNGLCAIAFTDDHYPVRSAFSLLNMVLEEYQKTFGESWRTTKEDATQPWQYLNDALTKYQDPAEADKLLKIQRDLDETKIILVSSCMFSDPRKHKYKACRNPMELFSCMRARQRGHQGKVLHCYGS